METRLLAGLWKVDVTPPLDRPLVGGVDDEAFAGILDNLYANALVLDDGNKEVAIVSVDIIGIPHEVMKDIVAGIEATCGIPASQVTISATHTHKGPPLSKDQADCYTETFKKQVVTAVYMARSKKQPVRIGVGRAENRDYVFNRRLKKPDGSIVMNWVESDFTRDCSGDGPVDPEMIVLKIEAADRQPIGFVVNYANHNNALPGALISADIAGYMGRMLRKLYGEDVVMVFLLGACGNVNWLDYRMEREKRRNFTYYQEIATGLLGTVLEIIPKMEYPNIAEVESLHETIQISERPFEEYDTKEDDTYGVGKDRRPFFDRMHGQAKRESEGKPLALCDVDLHALRIGDSIALATFPCELFVEYGLEVKARSPFKYTLIAELTNGEVGYVPTLKAYEEGGYEVRKPANCLEKDAGTRMTKVHLRLLEELAR